MNLQDLLNKHNRSCSSKDKKEYLMIDELTTCKVNPETEEHYDHSYDGETISYWCAGCGDVIKKVGSFT